MSTIKFPNDFKGPYGFGMMLAFTPFKGNLEKCKELIFKLYDKGVISFIAGSATNTRVRFLPPVGCIDEKDVDVVCEVLENSLLELGAK